MSSTAKEYTTIGLLNGIDQRLKTLYTEYNEEHLIHQADYAAERMKFMESKYVKDHDRAVRSIKKFIKKYLNKLHAKVSNDEIVKYLDEVCLNENDVLTYRAAHGTVVFLNYDGYVTFRTIDPATTPGIAKLFIPKVDPNNVRLAMGSNRI